ncbi:hypothetical protein C2S51_019219 [Perilla frutescens var. frutescens]|nr:hypothetical protein C2S51_019219 [Perilla frutescens var. frutescens]
MADDGVEKLIAVALHIDDRLSLSVDDIECMRSSQPTMTDCARSSLPTTILRADHQLPQSSTLPIPLSRRVDLVQFSGCRILPRFC